MIRFKEGNLLNDDVEALVNTVNCVGVMGRGIALQFKKKYPENFTDYSKACKDKSVKIGSMFIHRTNNLMNPKYIINFPTKDHWRGKSQLKYIQDGLKDLQKTIKELKIKSISIPPLGCGLGGLDWQVVKSIIESNLFMLDDVDITIYEPQDIKKNEITSRITKDKLEPQMTPGRAALIELIYRYLGAMLDPCISLLEIHKLMYFMQEAGEHLRLNYKKATYGPYAENLRHVLTRLEGYYIKGYSDGGDDPNKMIYLLPEAYSKASKYLKDHKLTQENFNKVSDLVEGFESSYGLELISTIHWVIQNNNIDSFEDVMKITYEWNNRKQRFTHSQIKTALTILQKKNWLSKSISI